MSLEKSLTVFLLFASLGLGTLVILLSRQNQALRAELNPRTRLVPQEPLRPGDQLTLASMDEVPSDPGIGTGARAGQRTLLLVFAHGCAPCEATMPIWEQMLIECPPNLLRVVGLSVDEADSEYTATEAPHPYPVHSLPASERAELLQRLPRLPASIILGESGIVESVWFGEPTPDEQSVLLGEICSAG